MDIEENALAGLVTAGLAGDVIRVMREQLAKGEPIVFHYTDGTEETAFDEAEAEYILHSRFGPQVARWAFLEAE